MPDSSQITPRGTAQKNLVWFDRFWGNFFMRIINFAALSLGGISLILLLNNILKFAPETRPNNGLLIFFIFVGMIFLPIWLFHRDVIRWHIPHKVSDGNKSNIFNYFSFSLAKPVLHLFGGRPFHCGDLMESLLKTSDAVFIFTRLGVGTSQIKDLIKNYQSDLPPANAFEMAYEHAREAGKNQITPGDVILAIFENDRFFADILNRLKLENKDIDSIVHWLDRINEEIESHKRIFTTRNFRLTGGVGRDWAFGYTLFLKHFSVDITNAIKNEGLGLEIVGHKKETDQIKEALLSDSGNNVLVVGEPGVGKRTTVLGFAKEVAEGKTASTLDYRHILQIDLDALMSGASAPNEVLERLNGLFSEAGQAGNVIIFIENFQNLISGEEMGQVDLSSMLLPLLESPTISIIGTCDIGSYNQYVANNTAMSQRMTRVSISEPSEAEMMQILENVVRRIEAQNNCLIPYATIKETYVLADRYLLNIPNPEKSINLLDRACAHFASSKSGTIIEPVAIAEYVSEKYKVPVGEAAEDEKRKLLVLEEDLHKSVIGQEHAIAAVSNALRRSRAGVENSKKPIGSFLFLGPTGVGKTETAKALAKVYFGGVNRMIRFDMSEYQNPDDIYRFIGSNIRGENIPGALTTAVRENPFSLLLFDEIEKAYKDILDLFLQILDEGFVTDGTGRKVSFSNCIIISTSNAGSDLIRSAISSGSDYENVKTNLMSYLQDKGIYRPEFLNRFTASVVFSPLSKDQILKVASMMLEELKGDIYKNKGIKIEITPEVLPVLAQAGFDPQMGARPMARTIQEKVEDMLAKKILSGQLNRGDTLVITPEEIS